MKIKAVKTLIIEFISSNGPSHIREIHLQVAEFRPEVPQHTVRARLSEMSRLAEQTLKQFGQGFYDLYQENRELCSVVSYPDRGPWGDSGYRGNCSGHMVKELILRFRSRSVFDPAEGSGTVRDVVSGINLYLREDIYYEGRDLRKGWDILTGDLPDRKFDMVWYHPPYWDIVRYSDRPDDLSNCASLEDFESRLNESVARLFEVVRPGGIMAILIGDKRKDGRYYALFRPLLINYMEKLRAIIIKTQHNCRSDRTNYAKSPFMIPIKHEYCFIFQR